MAWFPVYASFIEGGEFKHLTPREKLFFWHLVSEFNRRGEFYQSDLEIAKTLATSVETIRRARRILTKMGLILVKPGTLTRRKHYLATRYLKVRYATMDEAGFFGQVPRFTFQVMLHLLRKSCLQAGDVVVYVCLSYFYWRNYGNREDHQFFITKNILKSLTGLRDAPTRVPMIYKALTFSGGSHVFEYKEEYHKFIFLNWKTAADPDKNDNSRQVADMYIKEIKDLVTQNKHERQIKLQQKVVKLPQKTDGHVSSLITVFSDLYTKNYGRMPNSRGDNKLGQIEQIYGEGVIRQAINWYFTADAAPNGSRARTRTLGNFIAQIDEILKLSAQSAFV